MNIQKEATSEQQVDGKHGQNKRHFTVCLNFKKHFPHLTHFRVMYEVEQKSAADEF